MTILLSVYIIVLLIIYLLFFLNICLRKNSVSNWLFTIGFFIFIFMDINLPLLIIKLNYSWIILRKSGFVLILIAFIYTVIEDRKRKN